MLYTEITRMKIVGDKLIGEQPNGVEIEFCRRDEDRWLVGIDVLVPCELIYGEDNEIVEVKVL